MGLPILLIAIAAVVAILIAGCGNDAKSTSGSDSANSSASGDNASGAGATKALVASADLLRGPIPVAAFKDVTCSPSGGASEFSCEFGAKAAGGTSDSAGAIRIVFKDGEVAKRLGAAADSPTAAPTTSEAVGSLLASDDASRGGPSDEYACATSIATKPDGSTEAGGATGFLCVVTVIDGKKAGADEQQQRYVQFRDDGAATRDFVLKATT